MIRHDASHNVAYTNSTTAVENGPALVWVSSIMPDRTMDSATWLDTTDHLRRMGWQVTLIGVGPRQLTSVRGIEVRCLPRPKLYLLGPLLYHLYILIFLLRRWHVIDVILFDQISAIWLFPLRWLRGLSRRSRPLFVMDVRDLVDAVSTNWRIRLRLWFFHNVVFAMARRWTDGQTAITVRMAELVGIPQPKLLGVWPSGVNPALFDEARTARQWPSVDGPIELIYIGSFLAKRNLLPLSKAVVRAAQAGMNYRLSLYGNGKSRAELIEFADESNGVVCVFPPVPYRQVPELLAKAHVGITSLPSQDDIKYQASSPVKLFEYMAAGMPMLSTKNVCHTEVVAQGQYVFWADSPNEDDLFLALQTMWQQRARLSELGSQANAVVDQWSWRAAAQKLSSALLLAMRQRA